MQGNRTVPSKQAAALPTLADLLAAGELACSAALVAHWLKVSKPTVIASARRGELPGEQVGRQWRFSTIPPRAQVGRGHPQGGVGVTALPQPSKRCAGCGQAKLRGAFYQGRAGRLSSYCRACQRAVTRTSYRRRRQDPAALALMRAGDRRRKRQARALTRGGGR